MAEIPRDDRFYKIYKNTVKIPTKKYILWLYSDGGYHPREYDSAEEALLAERYTQDFYLTESINDISVYTRYK